MHLNLPKSERQMWRIYLTDHLGDPPPSYNPKIRIKFTVKSRVYRVLYDGKLVAHVDYSTTPPEITSC